MRHATLMILVGALAGCGPSRGQASTEQTAATPGAMTVTSPDMRDGGTLAFAQVYNRLGCLGSNRSPGVSWTAVEGAKSYAVVMFDPDAPGGGWLHWAVADIPADVTTLPTGAGRTGAQPTTGAVQGQTDFGSVGYGGACPPPGDRPHRYVLSVYALDVKTLEAGDIRAEAMRHALATGSITATYGR